MSIVLLLFILLLIGVIFSSFIITKIRIWRPKRTFWFATLYLTCGLLAFVYLLFLSSNIEMAATDEVLQQQIAVNKQLMADLDVRKFDSLREEHLKFTKTFEATAEDIRVIRNANSYYLPVVISWIDSNENKIVASYYETPLYLNRVYITPFVEEPTIGWHENNLHIGEHVSEVKAKSMRLSSELLEPNELGRFDDPHNELIGHRILHLNVPKQFNIIDSEWH